MNIKNEDLKAFLVEENYITEDEIKNADEYLKSDRGSLTEYLLNEGILTKKLLGEAIAEWLNVPFVNLEAHPPQQEKILQIPENVAVKHNVIFYSEDEKTVTVAADDPSDKNLPGELKRVFPKKNIVIGFGFLDEIHSLFVCYKKSLEERIEQAIKGQKHIASEIFHEVLDDAMAFRASDIHFEPYEKKVIIRFRIDGILQDVGTLPQDYYENVLNWVKIQSKIRIDEHRAPQDGSMRVVMDEKPIDMRVSIAPIIDGQNIVIRILTAYVKSFALTDLGFSSQDSEIVNNSAHLPFGMFLVTGPTGSGKTTTLYALIKLLNKPDLNITTIEDPIEYKIPGINQIQVNEQTRVTFAEGLRSIVRQDPNVILVGEIRDNETAEISVNAALTGHLLFSTFHANDAATAVPRLLDMGIEPFLLSSTLKLIVAQRLVRQICVHCRYSLKVNMTELKKKIPQAEKYFTGSEVLLYQGKGCFICANTGYRERIALFEIIHISPEMQNLILQKPSGQEIWKLAESQGARSLFEDGVEKVKQGITTIDEVLRVTVPQQSIPQKAVRKRKPSPDKK